jgi:hypothetical protein
MVTAGVEADGAVGPVDLMFDDEVPAGESRGIRHGAFGIGPIVPLFQVIPAGLEVIPVMLELMGPGCFPTFV